MTTDQQPQRLPSDIDDDLSLLDSLCRARAHARDQIDRLTRAGDTDRAFLLVWLETASARADTALIAAGRGIRATPELVERSARAVEQHLLRVLPDSLAARYDSSRWD